MNPKKSLANDLMTNLKILNQIGASILSEYTVEQIIDTVYEHVNKLMDAHSFAIGVYNPTTHRFEYTGARQNDQVLPFFSADSNNTDRFSGWVFTHKTEILINDFEHEYHQYLPQAIRPMQGMEPASLMYVPLFSNTNIIGLLSVRSPHKDAYDNQSMEILKTLAVFIGKAIENAHIRNSPKQPARSLPRSYFLDPLSARELEVLHHMSKGLSNGTIAEELFVSRSTIKTHTLNIYQKMEVANRTEAIVKAKEYGLIP